MCSGSLCEAQIWKIRYSEQARQVKTVKAHSWIAKSSMGQTVGGTQECQPHSLVIHRYRLGHLPVGTLCYKTLVFYKVAFPAQCTVGPTQAKSDLVLKT